MGLLLYIAVPQRVVGTCTRTDTGMGTGCGEGLGGEVHSLTPGIFERTALGTLPWGLCGCTAVFGGARLLSSLSHLSGRRPTVPALYATPPINIMRVILFWRVILFRV